MLYSLQRFIARRGRPERIYSDNGSSFTAAAKWIKMVTQDEKLQDYLSRNVITWQFNLSRAPWSSGQFFFTIVFDNFPKGLFRVT